MPPPEINSQVTQEQIDNALNIAQFPNATPGNNWHIGQFEPWSINYGYQNGMPIYGSIAQGNHIYWLNNQHQRPIILAMGETPATYGF